MVGPVPLDDHRRFQGARAGPRGLFKGRCPGFERELEDTSWPDADLPGEVKWVGDDELRVTVTDVDGAPTGKWKRYRRDGRGWAIAR